MSSVFEEILTSTTGFIIAMIIMGAVIGIGLYGYWLYVNHVTLENELMPIAEVVPYQGGYYLAIVNTGYEPFTVRQVYLKGGSILSVDSKSLTHNQWFFEQASQLPIAVMVCSAIDPRVCEIIPVHGWSVVDADSLLGIGWVNMTVLVDWWCHATVSWAAIGGDYGTSGSVTVSAYNSFGTPAYETVSVRTPGPLLIEIESSNSYASWVKVTITSPNGQTITPLLVYCYGPVNAYYVPDQCLLTMDASETVFKWLFIAEPNTALTIHVSCYVHT